MVIGTCKAQRRKPAKAHYMRAARPFAVGCLKDGIIGWTAPQMGAPNSKWDVHSDPESSTMQARAQGTKLANGTTKASSSSSEALELLLCQLHQ